MPNVTHSISVRQQHPNESSRFRSPRDRDDVRQKYKDIAALQKQLRDVHQTVEEMAKLMGKMRRRILGGAVQNDQTSFFSLVSDEGDSYQCNSFDGLNTGSQIIRVAKHQDLRCIKPTASPLNGGARTSRLNYDGTTDTYIYNPITVGSVVAYYTRGVTGSDGSSATSYVVPQLAIGDIITADPVAFNGPATLTGVLWIARADGRTWTDTIILPS